MTDGTLVFLEPYLCEHHLDCTYPCGSHEHEADEDSIGLFVLALIGSLVESGLMRQWIDKLGSSDE